MDIKLHQLFILKQKKDALTVQLKELKKQIFSIESEIGNSVIFLQDKKTLYYKQGNFTVKVVRRETLKWDQEKLNMARLFLGDETFFHLFDFEWKHKHRAILDDFLKNNVNAKIIERALTINNKFNVTIGQEV
ncbi:MAG: hypothetical protein K2I05_02165 [Mailhella sp.]|nr:hypothetical protein [Mailhella sp.]